VLELIAELSRTPQPLILAGDFNSDANGLYSPLTYGLLIANGGFSDAWSAVHPFDPGLTWGHDEFLAEPAAPFLLRIDLLLYRGRALSPTDAEIVNPAIGGPPPLWFSDHAGVFGSFAVQ
jgi:endonuclease/exonuclease/phosphatase (EEP) superfamily protein YafD